jgi:hypothetical protein
MATMTINDDAIWMKHIHDEQLRGRLLSLSAGDPVDIRVRGVRLRFRKMRNGRDGRATPGLRADASARAAWAALQKLRGETVEIELIGYGAPDPYLDSLKTVLTEWSSVEDNIAFNDL